MKLVKKTLRVIQSSLRRKNYVKTFYITSRYEGNKLTAFSFMSCPKGR